MESSWSRAEGVGRVIGGGGGAWSGEWDWWGGDDDMDNGDGSRESIYVSTAMAWYTVRPWRRERKRSRPDVPASCM